ncbi:MAG: elongation factor P [Verrucomicrobia bacterium]|nr:elongation factor P [Verrucomicrobiota bacterium]MBU1910169.1 elongation factor P [Verrucomicrobiota bacterium]
MYTVSDLRKGIKIELDGVPYEVVEFEFYKPGKGQAMYKCRLKNLLMGNTTDRTFRAVDKIGKPDLEERDLVYSYPEGDHYVFMDSRTFEQVTIGAEAIGNQKYFLVENIEVSVLFYNGRAIQVVLPAFVEKVIVETEPGARGDTATNVTKAAKLDNGYEIQVPLFINQGDTVRIDTRTGKYFDRVSKG